MKQLTQEEFASLANKVFGSEDGRAFLIAWAHRLGIQQSILAPVVKGQSVKLTPDQQLQRAAVIDVFHALYACLHPTIRTAVGPEIF